MMEMALEIMQTTTTDNDGALDTVDNCLYTPNADQLDTDGDGIGDVVISDDDNDGFQIQEKLAVVRSIICR